MSNTPCLFCGQITDAAFCVCPGCQLKHPEVTTPNKTHLEYVRAEIEADQEPCEHEWQWHTNPGTPDGPSEHIKSCKNCGMEFPGSDDDWDNRPIPLENKKCLRCDGPCVGKDLICHYCQTFHEIPSGENDDNCDLDAICAAEKLAEEIQEEKIAEEKTINPLNPDYVPEGPGPEFAAYCYPSFPPAEGWFCKCLDGLALNSPQRPYCPTCWTTRPPELSKPIDEPKIPQGVIKASTVADSPSSPAQSPENQSSSVFAKPLSLDEIITSPLATEERRRKLERWEQENKRVTNKSRPVGYSDVELQFPLFAENPFGQSLAANSPPGPPVTMESLLEAKRQMDAICSSVDWEKKLRHRVVFVEGGFLQWEVIHSTRSVRIRVELGESSDTGQGRKYTDHFFTLRLAQDQDEADVIIDRTCQLIYRKLFGDETNAKQNNDRRPEVPGM